MWEYMYLWRPLFPNKNSEHAIGTATSNLGLLLITFWKRALHMCVYINIRLCKHICICISICVYLSAGFKFRAEHGRCGKWHQSSIIPYVFIKPGEQIIPAMSAQAVFVSFDCLYQSTVTRHLRKLVLLKGRMLCVNIKNVKDIGLKTNMYM